VKGLHSGSGADRGRESACRCQPSSERKEGIIINHAEIISHFAILRDQALAALKNGEEGEICEWMRGLYLGEIQAYQHCIEYLSASAPDE